MDINQLLKAMNQSNNTATSSSSEDKITSEYRLIIGTYDLNPETDEMQFIQLPRPLYLDTMPKNKVYGNSESAKAMASGNELLDQILELAQTLEPGQSEEINLVVKIARKNEQTTSPTVKFNLQFKKE